VVVRHRASHIFLDSGLTDGGEAVSLTRQPASLYPQESPGAGTVSQIGGRRVE
jgi:hypothetical protein